MTTHPEHCFECEDGIYQEVVVNYKASTRDGVEIVVPDVKIFRCQSCGEETVPAASVKQISQSIAEANDQLKPADLYTFLENSGRNQKQISEICGFGEKTFHRWLKGTQVVSRSMGFYLRVLQRFPEAFEWVEGRKWREKEAAGVDSSQAIFGEVSNEELQPFEALRGRDVAPIMPKHNPARGLQEARLCNCH